MSEIWSFLMLNVLCELLKKAAKHILHSCNLCVRLCMCESTSVCVYERENKCMCV